MFDPCQFLLPWFASANRAQIWNGTMIETYNFIKMIKIICASQTEDKLLFPRKQSIINVINYPV